MILTKYEHACVTLEEDNQILVIDPGGLTTDFIAPEGVVVIVITHEHFDHFDHDQIAAIVDKNPEAMIIGHQAITSQIEVFTTRSVEAGNTIDVGPFHMVFTGGQHALIHASIPVIANLGVLINELFYYPGDSFVLPGQPIDTLAVPAGAPWMKTGEAMDFLGIVGPRLAFPTHDRLLSEQGKAVADRLLGGAAQTHGIEYVRLKDSLSI